MGIEDYYRKTVEVVEDLTGITEPQIRGRSKLREVVDARWLVIMLLRDKGYYTSQIASQMKLGIRQVQVIVATFDIRMRWAEPSLRINYETAANILRNS